MRLSPADIFRPFAFETADRVVAAVSGGSDSLALLFLLRDHLAALDNPPALLAVTVDHRLRAESAVEAEAVAALCRRQGIAHRILAWDDPKPAGGVAAAARSARYRLLVQAAREAGAGFIVTGHTRDDQIETFLMRKARSTSAEARGLAAMAARSWLEGMGREGSVELVRPLLHVSRQELRDDLTARGVTWIEDPSNADTAYERPRVRHGEAAAADPASVLALVALASAARERDNRCLADALADPASLRLDATGAFLVDAGIHAALPDNVRLLFSGLLAALAGGRRFLPGEGERARIERVLAGEGKSGRITVFGALIERGRDGAPHRFRRERRNLPRLHLAPGESGIWDGRFRLTNAGHEAMEIAAPERQELAVFLEERGIETESRKREALLVLPALHRGGRLAALPFLPGCEWPRDLAVERHFALFDHVLPGYDFTLACAVEQRVGRECRQMS